jgi:hypothetical protein
MTTHIRHSILILCFAIAACTSSKKNIGHNSLNATDLLPYGRTAITDNKLELISSAAHFGFSFEGNDCEIYASVPARLHHNYLQYELDGVYQKRIKISKDDKSPLHLTASNNGKHTVWIYKATEATTGPVFIEKIHGNNIKSIPNSTAPLIEFIGNSITCGAAADASEMPCGKGEYHDYHNAYYAYGPRVARQLDANYIMSSVSGIGIYRTWNHEEPSMPQVYDKTDFQAGSTRNWDFSKYSPKIVSIALGTNDLSNGDGKSPRTAFDSAKFVNSYFGFVQFVKSKYPKAQIVFLSSPMVSGDRNTLLQNCLQTIKMKIDSQHPSDEPVSLFFFKPMQAKGCSGHPSVEDHAILAEELLPFFKSLMNRQ